MKLICLSRHWLLTCLLAAFTTRADMAVLDGYGQFKAIVDGNERLDVRTRLAFVSPGWAETIFRHSPQSTPAKWWPLPFPSACASTIRSQLPDGTACDVTTTISNAPDHVSLDISFRSERPVPLRGVFLWVEVSAGDFTGGTVRLGEDVEAPLPTQQPFRFSSQSQPQKMNSTGARFRGHDGSRLLNIRWDRPLTASVQDERPYGKPCFTLLLELHKGPLETGLQRVSLQLDARVPEDHSPGRVVLGEATGRRFDGFGGSFCYAHHGGTGVSDYALREFPHRWARVRAALDLWEPANDNANPRRYRRKLRRNKEFDPALLQEFEMARKLAKAKKRIVLSVWDLPQWMYTPETRELAYGREVSAQMWPEVVECVTSYLKHLRKEYDVEPELFSFNEPFAGIRVRIPTEEAGDRLQLLTAAMKKAGLKTRLLMADFAQPAFISEAEEWAMQPGIVANSRALGFHTWTTPTPEYFVAWRDLADKLKIPLLVTELGSDASSWFVNSFVAPEYAIDDTAVTLDSLRYAQPLTVMPWELSDNYAPGARLPNGEIALYGRGRFLRQLFQQTGPGHHIEILACEPASVKAAAFRTDDGNTVLHLLNRASSRRITLEGVPRGTPRQQVITPTEDVGGIEFDHSGNKTSFTVPGGSLISLTWPERPGSP